MTGRRFCLLGLAVDFERGGQATQWPWWSITVSRQHPRPHACGSTAPAINEKNWTCDGTGLVVPRDRNGIQLGTPHLPAVIRADLIPRADPAIRRMIAEGGTEPFHGGDHAHLVIEPEESHG